MTIAGAYNRFYQVIYGTDCCYLPPAGLRSWLSQIPVTSQQQLEQLFVLYNAALCRSPLQDAQRVAKKRQEKRLGAFGRQQKSGTVYLWSCTTLWRNICAEKRYRLWP